jgi:regulator of replication initiation timing
MVLLATAPEVITLVKNNQASVRKHLDEMKLQLEPILDEDQKLRLEERYNRRRQRDLEKK